MAPLLLAPTSMSDIRRCYAEVEVDARLARLILAPMFGADGIESLALSIGVETDAFVRDMRFYCEERC